MKLRTRLITDISIYFQVYGNVLRHKIMLLIHIEFFQLHFTNRQCFIQECSVKVK